MTDIEIPDHVKCPTCGEKRALVQRTREQGRILDLYWRCHSCPHRVDASGIGQEAAVHDFRLRWVRKFRKA